MANIKYIITTLVVSAILLGLMALWIGHRSGEVQLLQKQESEALSPNSALPGPLSVDEEKEVAQENSLANTEEPMTTESTHNPKVTFHTSKGDITLEMFADAMPITVGNFTKLAKEGFYNNSKFHRVIEGFMIQGGDPNSKGDNTSIYGQGGPGYTIQDEFVADPRLTNVRGTIAMANTGQPNSGGSQFFINLVDNTNLDFDKIPMTSRHPVFGKVIAGMNVVDGIGSTETGPRDLPVEPVIITSVSVE